MQDSPAQRYAKFRHRQVQEASAVARFAHTVPFELDDFQIEANQALEDGRNVLVAAPTGAGKTVAADFAMFLAQERNVKAFYTTPIKALSNQKYHDLVAVYGSEKVGLLTGDTSINAQADIVVMTTEVLRNMLYEHSTTLDALRYVVLDEVHYLADRLRGPVWEEVIIHLPEAVRIVALSATVSNVEDFSSWIASVRGDTQLIVSERRPVPLEQHVMIQADPKTEPEVIDLYRRDAAGEQTIKINAGLIDRLDQLDRRAARHSGPDHAAQHRGGKHEDFKHASRHHTRGADDKPQRHTPRRWAVVDELHYMGLLPGIYFIFSRNGCDQAVQQCLEAGLQLTDDDEARHIRQIVDEMAEGEMSYDDLKALSFPRFRFALEQGFAPHHAGMIALFRQIVETLFEMGLVKMVFATETLALGINMPARSVVVEKLEKFNGVEHVSLTPGEFTQLTGRAGRRGIDTLGHAIVVDHRGFVPATAASLSSKRVYPLHSSFKATFNMAVNLLNTSDYDTTRGTLDHSFAQWEANESAWKLESRMTTLQQAIAGYEQAFACGHGDFRELMDIRMRLADLEKEGRRELKHREFTDDAERRQAFHKLDAQIAELRRLDREHPCRSCPDLAQHMTWGHRWMREERELRRVTERYDARTGSVARQFDRICDILLALGYLERRSGSDNDLLLTDRGQLLRHLYGEQDLVLAQTIVDGAFDALTPQGMAAALSSLVYESRRGGMGEPHHYPGGAHGAVAQTCDALRKQSSHIDALCRDYGLEPMQQPDFGVVDIMDAWSSGADLVEVLHDNELTGGDFVRTAKRLADMLQQVAIAAPYLGDSGEQVARIATKANHSINRGVVAYSGVG
ncbi:DEAD/DEAH box helicase [Bifidobacterium tibiigranuli]|jgi:ATP-dependent RNA helicase HelY|uniref:DEAD/DEAH box helicase n=1 Tax=Bifidobacterium tibiigranuli TaxID=2172043 RepID=UPI0023541188|nr:DEAD/DEAH box helicase [Bifidobacterium tibiigranuli]MCI1211929.1 DEAD/DEAH box helicase [Bifidobacterium tibiigranuli]MCI1221852.1 DEAD/DEAH box helicase [Bifidobacterium tibiigranuli]